MKQSHNALTYLLAQYRAVYGRAYVKGLASLVVMTSAAAAITVPGTAEAQTQAGADSWNDAQNTADITIKGSNKLSLEKNFFKNITVAQGGTLEVGQAPRVEDTATIRGTLKIENGGRLSTTGSIYSWDHLAADGQSAATGILENKSGGRVFVGSAHAGSNNGQVLMNRVTLASGSDTVIQGGSGGNWDDYSTLGAGYDNSPKNNTDYAINVNKGAQLTITNNGMASVEQGTTLRVNGNVTLNSNSSDAGAILRAADNYVKDNYGNNVFTSVNADRNIIFTANANVHAKGSGHNAIYGQTVNLINGAHVTVDQGGKLYLDGDFLNSGVGVADAQHGAAQINVDGRSFLTIESGGRLVVGKGSYNLNGATDPNYKGPDQTTLTFEDDATLSGAGTLEVHGTTELTQSVLEGFLGNRNSPSTPATGHMDLVQGSTVQVNGDGNLGEFTFEAIESDGTNTNSSTADILVRESAAAGDAAVLKTDGKFTVGTALTSGQETLNLNLESTELQLGGDRGFVSADQALGFKKASAKNVVFNKDFNSQGVPTKFTLQDAVTVYSDGSATAKSTGDVVISGGDDKPLQYTNGEATHSGNITLKSGHLLIGGASDQYPNDSVSFKQTSGAGSSEAPKMTFDNTGNNVITIADNLSTEQPSSDNQAVYDLQGTKLVIDRDTTGSGNITQINVGSGDHTHAMLKITDKQLGEITNSAGAEGTGANVIIRGKGVVSVSGANAVLNAGKVAAFDSSATPESDRIYFDNGGTLQADTLTLDNSDGSVLNAGTGTINTKALTLQGSGEFVLQGGTVEATSSLTANEGITGLTIQGDATNSAALKITGASGFEGQTNITISNSDPAGSTQASVDIANSQDVALGAINISGAHTALNLNASDVTATSITNNSGTMSVSGGSVTADITGNGGSLDFTGTTVSGTNISITAGTASFNDTDVTVAEAFTSSGDLTVSNSSTLNTKDLTLGGGQTTIDGTSKIVVANGTATIDGASFSGTGSLELDAATTTVSKSSLDSLLADQNGEHANLVLKSDSKVTLSDTDTVDLAKYTYDAQEQGNAKIHVIDNGSDTVAATISGTKLAVSKALADGTALDLKVEAQDLTLGSADFKSSEKALGFAEATAQNVTFTGGTDDGGNFVLQDSLNLHAVGNEAGGQIVAASGNSQGKVVLAGAASDKSYHVSAGNITHSGDMTLSGGKLVVGNSSDAADSGVESSLSFAEGSNVTFNNVNAANEVLIANNGAGRSASLDLTKSTVSVTRSTNLTNINVGSGDNTAATLKVTGEQLETLIDKDKPAKSGAAIILAGEAVLDVDTTGAQPTLAFENLASGDGSTASSDTIYFNAGGTLHAQDLTLEGNSASVDTPDALDIGSGRVDVAGALKVSDKASGATKAVIASGVFNVGTTLDSDNTTLQLGVDGAVNGVVMALGQTGSTESGSIGTDLDLRGGTVLSVNGSDWTAQNIAIQGSGSTFELGSSSAAEADPQVNFSGSSLALSSGGAANVNANGNATFESLTLKDNSKVQVFGNMTITTSVDTASENAGTVVIDGTNASLTFDSAAADQIDFNTDKNSINASGYGKVFDLENNSKLNLNLGADQELTENQLVALRNGLIADYNGTGLIEGGVIHLGDAKISEINIDAGEIFNWDQFKEKFQDFADFATSDLDSSIASNVDAEDVVTGNIGSIHANLGVDKVQTEDLGLSTAKPISDGKNVFITNDNEAILGAIVKNDSHLKLSNGGYIGDISLEAGSGTDPDNPTVLIIDSSGTASNDITHIASVGSAAADGSTANTKMFVGGETIVSGDVSIGNLVVNRDLTVEGTNGIVASEGLSGVADVTINSKSIDVTGSTDYAGNAVIAGDASFNSEQGETKLAGNFDVSGDSTFTGNTELSGNLNVSGTLTFNGTTKLSGENKLADTTFNKNTEILGKTTTATAVTLGSGLDTLTIADGGTALFDSLTADNNKQVITVGRSGAAGTSGALGVSTLSLKGSTLFVDPASTNGPSVVAIGKFSTTDNQAPNGVIDGNLLVGNNAAVSIGSFDGTTNNTPEELLTQLRNHLSSNNLLDSNGALGDYKALLVLNESTRVQDGSYIVVDHKLTSADSSAVESARRMSDGHLADLALSDGSAMLVNMNAFSEGETQTAALTFEKTNAAVKSSSSGSTIMLTGEYGAGRELKLFADQDAAGAEGVRLDGGTITVYSENKEWSAQIKAGDNIDDIVLTYNPNGDTDPDDPNNPTDPSDPNNPGSSNNNPSISGPANDIENSIINDYKGNTGNNFLDSVAVKSTDKREYDDAMHLGVFGGAIQAAIVAGNSTNEMILSRMGIGHGKIGDFAFSRQGTRGSFWANPVYKYNSTDGFDADGISHGVDLDLYGIAVGADMKLSRELTLGAMLNIGGGSADGNDKADRISNDFNYYGFGAYLGFTKSLLTVVGDLSYTVVDSDITGSSPVVENIETSFDTTNLSLGVTGKVDLEIEGLEVSPHIGLRFNQIKMDDYSVKGQSTGDFANYDSDELNIFSIPVGVTVAKEFKSRDWVFKPSVDLTLQGNFGDTDTSGTINFAKTTSGPDLHFNTNSEVLDDFTYGVAAGVSGQNGNFSFGVGLNYQGSSNTTEFGIQANAKYVF